MGLKISQQVENILKHDPKSRDSDIRLLIIYMQKAGMNLSEEQIKVFKKLPAMETITRVRRQLQEQGKYPASPKVEEARYQKFKEVKSNINLGGAEESLHRAGYAIAADDPWNN